MAQKSEVDIKSKCTKMLVAAIDFGTTYSGYAFSFKSDWRKVHLQTCYSDTFVSQKAPTALLLNPDKSFCAFGSGAEKTYIEMTSEHDSDSDSDSEEKTKSRTKRKQNWKEHYYFHRFKMLLHKDEMLHRDSEIKDITGKPMKALDVFAISIKHLKDSMLEEMNKKVTDDILETDIDFVITVPAIWGDAAKMFMREAAVRAEINTEQLILALEPEAASIYCQFCHPKDKNDNDTSEHYDAFRQVVREKRKYMVVDLGGGTGDITVHKLGDDNKSLEEMIPATGGPVGGTTVDKAFEAFLENVGGKGVLETFKKSFMEDYLMLLTEFESKKRCGGDSDESKVRITVPLELERLLKKNCGCVLSTALEKSQYKGRVAYRNKKLIFEPSIFKSFFLEAIDGIINCIEDILKYKTCADMKDIIMVGGFSESKLIQNSLRVKFNSYRFLVPDESGLAVLKGAVYFGHIPDAISKRVSRFTYGVQICRKFKPGEDPEDRKISLGGVDRCVGVMHPIVRRGDRIEAGGEHHHSFQALKHEKGKFDCGIYISDQREPKFVDDKGCRCLGMLEIEVSDIKRGTYAEIEETFIFGETELTFRAKHLGSGRPVEQTFDMLNQYAKKLPPANK